MWEATCFVAPVATPGSADDAVDWTDPEMTMPLSGINVVDFSEHFFVPKIWMFI